MALVAHCRGAMISLPCLFACSFREKKGEVERGAIRMKKVFLHSACSLEIMYSEEVRRMKGARANLDTAHVRGGGNSREVMSAVRSHFFLSREPLGFLCYAPELITRLTRIPFFLPRSSPFPSTLRSPHLTPTLPNSINKLVRERERYFDSIRPVEYLTRSEERREEYTREERGREEK